METPASAAGATSRPDPGPGDARQPDRAVGAAQPDSVADAGAAAATGQEPGAATGTATGAATGAGGARGRGRRAWRMTGGALLGLARVTLTLGLVALLAVVVLYLRLLQGPIVLPGLAEMAAERINATTEQFRVSAGDAVFSLGEGDTPPGLRFRQVEVRTADGQRLFAAPRLAARFSLADLVQGQVRPLRILLMEPELQIIRAEDGTVRFGLGDRAGIALGAAGEVEGDAGADAAGRLIDGFVGDTPPVPALAKLERVAIVRANVVYDDRMGDGGWRTDHATLRLMRTEQGARLVMEIESAPPSSDSSAPASAGGAAGSPGPAVRLVAERRRGEGRTEVTAQFGRIETAELARQSRQLEWIGLIGGRVEGEARATVERDFGVSRLDGTLIAEDGTIRGLGEPMPFDVAQLSFSADPVRERLTVEDFRLSAASVQAGLRGFADLQRLPDGGLRGLAGQFDVGALHLDLPDVFADPLVFDGGRLTARWSLDEQHIEVIDARLARGALAFTVDGSARATEEGWITDLRAEAEGMTVDDLVAFWPLAAAINARTWIDERIPVASIDRLTAQMRIGRGDPLLSLDFDYSGLDAHYVGRMSPIEAASGTGHVTFNELYLDMSAGHVEPVAGARVDLGGSSMAINGFWAEVPTAEIALKAEGPTQAVLALIDQEPLALVSKLGRELGPVDGRTRVDADLIVPLLKDLEVEEIGAEAQATLSDVAMAFAVEPGTTVDVSAERLQLEADTENLSLSGEARLDGAPVVIEWREEYGPGQGGRVLALSGTATPALLSAAGASDLPIDGAPPFDLAIRQQGDGPIGLTLEADLASTSLEVGALDWVKPQGMPARLRAEGGLEGGLNIRSLRFESPSLEAEGAVRLTGDGRLERAELGRVRMNGLGDFAATLARGADGVMEVRLSGQRLDLSERVADAGGGGGGQGEALAEPLRLSFDVAELRLSQKVALTPAEGRVEQSATGALSGRVDGRIGGAAPVAITLDIPAAEPGRVRITSPDAGAALRAANLYPGAEGGTMTVNVRTGTEASPGLSGEARIEDVVVRSQSTFRNVLRDGGLAEAEAEVAGGGIRFRSVVVPFTYRGDLITLTDAIAVSPLLAVKVNGTMNEATDRLDLRGVLSPAYALTGALNEVPLIGALLGGRGEGILAITFRLRGSADDPQFTVNPLSVLAPGFLRRMFTAPSGEVSEEFQERIRNPSR